MKKNDIIIFVSAIVTGLSLITTTTVYAQQQQIQLPQQAAPQAQQHAQLTPQEQQLSNCPPSEIQKLPPPVPGAFPVCAGSPLLKGAPSSPSRPPIPPGTIEKGEHIMQSVIARLAHSPHGTTQAQVLQQMTNEGKINCPATTNPNHPCLLNPPPTAANITLPVEQ